MSDKTIPLPTIPSSCPPCPSLFPLFREYIGPKSTKVPIKFSEVTNRNYSDVHFHFILSFARDYDCCHNRPTNGKFIPHWDQVNLSPQEVRNIKSKYQNVKVVLGIGDREFGEFPFDPSCECDNDSWTTNAAVSIQKIMDEYCLDGLEVNYESINVGKHEFASYIGELIKKLKEANQESYFSIAPSAYVQAHYRELYEKYNEYIDIVDYQIYTHHPLTVEEFKQVFKNQKKIYGQKLLVGVCTDLKENYPLYLFETATPQLKSEGELKGIFISSAEDSKLLPIPYYFEIFSQDLLHTGV